MASFHTSTEIADQGAYRTVKVVFQDHLCPFSMSFQDCLIEWILNESDFRICNTLHNYTKQQIEPRLTGDNDNVCKGRKHAHGSEMRQPFGLFSMTFQDLGLISRLSRPGKFDFKFHGKRTDAISIHTVSNSAISRGVLLCDFAFVASMPWICSSQYFLRLSFSKPATLTATRHNDQFNDSIQQQICPPLRHQ